MIGIDLFAGAGGMSCGARAAGVDVQSVVENDINSARTYIRNHNPKFGVHADDIRTYDPGQYEFDRDQGVIVFGGPPCQGFSTSNQRTRTSKNENNWLFMEFVRVVSAVRPDYFVFENVRGILETEGGIFVNRIKDQFEKLGFLTTSKILHTMDYGIPQKRARFFMVGSSNGTSYQFPKPTCTRAVTVADALSDLPYLKNGASECYRSYRCAAYNDYMVNMRGILTGCTNHLVTRNSNAVLTRYKHIPQGGNWENIPDRLMKNYADKTRCHTGIYRRLKLDQPSVVIGNYRKNMLVHPTQNRGLSVREAARIQSFPDDFVFKGSIGFQQQQVGNAVPPILAKQVFASLISQHTYHG